MKGTIRDMIVIDKSHPAESATAHRLRFRFETKAVRTTTYHLVAIERKLIDMG
jgi:hypothetical protein